MHQGNLILFDYDGVIVDSLEHNVGIAMDCARMMGLDHFPPIDEIRNMANMTFEAVGLRMGLSTEDNEALIHCVFERLTAGVDRLSVFPGIPRLFKALSAKHVVAVLTANGETGVRRLLDHQRLSKYIAAVWGRDHAGTKSDKARKLMKRFSVEKEKVYLIGDTVSDISEARKAGVKSIAVTWGFQDRERLLTERPDFVVNQPEEIVALLNGDI